ncbi:MAG: phosphonate ABC transporter, permease protein PhnE, partial [Pseudomonadota bacterium]|nr:phosphonate ABC transporter, permease protein PhnE [Pseudomonadota bacterium]
MSMMNAAELNRLAERYPQVLERSFWQRYRIPVSVGIVALYFLFCWWFFAIGKTLSEANWGIAGNYLADWVSYEVRPEFDIDADGAMTISYPRFDPIGPNPNPDWISSTRETITRSAAEIPAASTAAPAAPKPSSSFSFMTSPTPQAPAAATGTEQATTAPAVTSEEVITQARVALSDSATLDISGERVILTRGDDTVTLLLDRTADTVTIEGSRPDWVEQRYEGGRVIAYFGSAGWIDVSSDRVRVRKRFFGWENFI